MKESKHKRAVVLLVEDSPSDQVAVERALEDGKVKCRLITVENGIEAIKLLHGKPPYDDQEQYPKPDIVLMDINMPLMDGKQALIAIRQDPALQHIPVIMLTTSSHDRDVFDSYRLGVNAYITKPVDEKAFINALVTLENFWLELVTLPPDLT